MLNTGTYWYVVLGSNHSWSDIYAPRYMLRPDTDPQVALGTLLQIDYLCVFGCALTWLCYQIRNLKVTGQVETSWAWMVATGILVGAIFGPGTLWWVGWMAREEILASAQNTRDRDLKKRS
jgi:hypothetical protein